jgi:hypothetical protein
MKTSKEILFQPSLGVVVMVGMLSCLTVFVHAAPITPVSVDASSTFHAYNKDNLINDSGLAGGLHDSLFQNMWLNDRGEGTAGTLTFDLGNTYDITSTDIWQYNLSSSPTVLARGAKGFDIFGSTDGFTFALIQSSLLAVSGGGSIAAQNIALFSTASHIRFDITSNYGAAFTGLSEVKFNGDVSAPPNGVIPESSTILLFGTGLAALGAWRYRKGMQA